MGDTVPNYLLPDENGDCYVPPFGRGTWIEMPNGKWRMIGGMTDELTIRRRIASGMSQAGREAK